MTLLLTIAALLLCLVSAEASCENISSVGTLCVASLVKDLLAVPGVNASDQLRSRVKGSVQDFLGQCLGMDVKPLRPINLLLMEESRNRGAQFLKELIMEQLGIESNLTFAALIDLTQEVVADLTAPERPTLDGFVIDPSAVVDLTELQALAPLEDFVLNDPNIAWADVLPFFRQVATIYDGHLVGVPFTGQVSVMYYRKDVLQRLKAPVPATWDDLLLLARAVNGTDLNGDGVPDHAICWQMEDCLEAPVLLVQVAAPLIQSTGTAQGWLFDPSDMTLLLNSTATLEALRLLRELQKLVPPGIGCNLVHMNFITGACAFTIKWSELFKATEMYAEPLRGYVGVAQLPGSTRVLNRATGQLEPCTPTSCPHATNETSLAAGGRTVLVNRAPHFGFGSFAGATRKGIDPGYQQAVYTYFANLAGPATSWEFLLDVRSPVGPFRAAHVDQTNEVNFKRWTDRGYHPNDTRGFLTAWTDSIRNPNVALEIRILNSFKYRRALINATVAMLAGQPLDTIVADLAKQMMAILDGTPKNRSSIQAAYRTGLGYTSTPPAQPPKEEHHTSSSSRHIQRIYLSILSVCLTCGALVALYWWWSRVHRRSILGEWLPPKPRPETTLLVATLPDLPELLRDLPESVVCRALSQYLSLMRKLLRQYRGYEAVPPATSEEVLDIASDPSMSLTASALAATSIGAAAVKVRAAAVESASAKRCAGGEENDIDAAAAVESAALAAAPLTPEGAMQLGPLAADSWFMLCAFDNPRDALHFAAAAQQGLMQLDWPLALLRHRKCEPLHALPVQQATALADLRARVTLASTAHPSHLLTRASSVPHKPARSRWSLTSPESSRRTPSLSLFLRQNTGLSQCTAVTSPGVPTASNHHDDHGELAAATRWNSRGETRDWSLGPPLQRLPKPVRDINSTARALLGRTRLLQLFSRSLSISSFNLSTSGPSLRDAPADMTLATGLECVVAEADTVGGQHVKLSGASTAGPSTALSKTYAQSVSIAHPTPASVAMPEAAETGKGLAEEEAVVKPIAAAGRPHVHSYFNAQSQVSAHRQPPILATSALPSVSITDYSDQPPSPWLSAIHAHDATTATTRDLSLNTVIGMRSAGTMNGFQTAGGGGSGGVGSTFSGFGASSAAMPWVTELPDPLGSSAANFSPTCSKSVSFVNRYRALSRLALLTTCPVEGSVGDCAADSGQGGSGSVRSAGGHSALLSPLVDRSLPCTSPYSRLGLSLSPLLRSVQSQRMLRLQGHASAGVSMAVSGAAASNDISTMRGDSLTSPTTRNMERGAHVATASSQPQQWQPQQLASDLHSCSMSFLRPCAATAAAGPSPTEVTQPPVPWRPCTALQAQGTSQGGSTVSLARDKSRSYSPLTPQAVSLPSASSPLLQPPPPPLSPPPQYQKQKQQEIADDAVAAAAQGAGQVPTLPTPAVSMMESTTVLTDGAAELHRQDGGGISSRLQVVRLAQYYRAAYKVVNSHGQIMSYLGSSTAKGRNNHGGGSAAASCEVWDGATTRNGPLAGSALHGDSSLLVSPAGGGGMVIPQPRVNMARPNVAPVPRLSSPSFSMQSAGLSGASASKEVVIAKAMDATAVLDAAASSAARVKRLSLEVPGIPRRLSASTMPAAVAEGAAAAANFPRKSISLLHLRTSPSLHSFCQNRESPRMQEVNRRHSTKWLLEASGVADGGLINSGRGAGGCVGRGGGSCLMAASPTLAAGRSASVSGTAEVRAASGRDMQPAAQGSTLMAAYAGGLHRASNPSGRPSHEISGLFRSDSVMEGRGGTVLLEMAENYDEDLEPEAERGEGVRSTVHGTETDVGGNPPVRQMSTVRPLQVAEGGLSCMQLVRALTSVALAAASALAALPVRVPTLCKTSASVAAALGAAVEQRDDTESEVELGLLLADIGVVLQRGLRVCMGLSSGVAPGHVSYNRAAKRMQYGGPSLQVARALSYAALGTASRLLLSGMCYKQLGGWSGGDERSRMFTVLNVGGYKLQRPYRFSQPLDLYMPLTPSQGPCLTAHRRPRGAAQTQAGVMEAPLGDATIVFCNVVGVSALMAWDLSEARSALALFQAVATRQLAAKGGYLVELADGLCLAAFTDPEAAIRWGLTVLSRLLSADWCPRLLEHELCEEVVVQEVRQALESPGPPGHAGATRSKSLLLTSPSLHKQHHLNLHPHLYRTNQQQQMQPQPQQQGQVHLARSAPFISAMSQKLRSPSGPGLALTTGGASGGGGSGAGSGGGGVNSTTLCRGSSRIAHRNTSASHMTRVLYRGLRLRIGIDVGRVKAEISAVTGRVSYRGKAMNRAARIAAKAPAGQLWCSGDVWRACGGTSAPPQLPSHLPHLQGQMPPPQQPSPAQRCSLSLRVLPRSSAAGGASGNGGGCDDAEGAPVTARYQGRHQLKGVAEPMDLWNCRFDIGAIPGLCMSPSLAPSPMKCRRVSAAALCGGGGGEGAAMEVAAAANEAVVAAAAAAALPPTQLVVPETSTPDHSVRGSRTHCHSHPGLSLKGGGNPAMANQGDDGALACSVFAAAPGITAAAVMAISASPDDGGFSQLNTSSVGAGGGSSNNVSFSSIALSPPPAPLTFMTSNPTFVIAAHSQSHTLNTPRIAASRLRLSTLPAMSSICSGGSVASVSDSNLHNKRHAVDDSDNDDDGTAATRVRMSLPARGRGAARGSIREARQQRLSMSFPCVPLRPPLQPSVSENILCSSGICFSSILSLDEAMQQRQHHRLSAAPSATSGGGVSGPSGRGEGNLFAELLPPSR